MGRRSSFSKRQIEGALRATAGIHQAAADLLAETYGRPCSRHVIARALDRWPDLRAVYDEMTEVVGDLAEGKLYQQIKNDNTTAIIFYLKTKHRHRGYVERREHISDGGGEPGTGSGRVATRVDYASLDKLTDEELARLYFETLGA